MSFRQILDERLIVVINLAKGLLGEGNSALLGAFFVAGLQKAAMARADSQQSARAGFHLYLDEWQNYTTDNIRDIISESRKFGLSLHLANQFPEQVPQDLFKAALNATGTLMCFRLSYQSAKVMVHELLPTELPVESSWQQGFLRVGRFGFPFPVQVQKVLGPKELVTMLTVLAPREFVLKRRGPYAPVKLITLEAPTPGMTPELLDARQQLIRISGERYGILKAEARREVEQKTLAPDMIDGQYLILSDWEKD